MKKLAVILTLSSLGPVFGQSVEIDRIRRELAQTREDTARVRLYHEASQQFTFHNIKTALTYGDSSYSLAVSRGFEKGIRYAGLNQAYLYRIKGNYRRAIEILHQARHHLPKEEGIPDPALNLYSWLGKNHYELGQYDSAFYWTRRRISVAENDRKFQELVYAYSDYANISYRLYDYQNAVAYYTKADSVCERHNISSVTYLSALGRLGKMRFNKELYEEAKDYLNQVQRRFIEGNHPAGEAEIAYSLGLLEYNCDNPEAALPHLELCLDYFSSLEMYPKEMAVQEVLGEIYREKGELNRAREHFSRQNRISEQLDDHYNRSRSLSHLGSISYLDGAFEEAIDHYARARDVAAGLGDIILTHTASRGLAQAYLKNGDLNLASEEFSKILEIQDSVDDLRRNERILVQFAEWQASQRKREIELLISQNELAAQQKRNQRNILLGGIGLTTLAGVFMFLLLRNRQKTNRRLKEVDRLKSNFFTNISHEFRTPLTLITGPLERKLAGDSIAAADRKEWELMKRNADRLLNLVEQLLDLSKLKSGKYPLQVLKGNPGSLINALAESFAYRARNRQISYQVDIEPVENAWFDPDILEKIVSNLLSNALKYTAEQGSVTLTAGRNGKNLCIEVENSIEHGKAVSIERLFDRFYQDDPYAEGAGIGLSLVRELTERSHGRVTVAEIPEFGLRFRVVLPIDEYSYQAEERRVDRSTGNGVYELDGEAISGETSEGIPVQNDERKIVLIVDDQQDVRLLIRQSLEPGYCILEAENGAAGIQQALTRIPDLIISDIMMPETDGLELCNVLKNDERTSHIPIILLTARAGEEDEYQGLASGADAYVTKPFSLKILGTRAKNLIESRVALRDRFSRQIVLKPREIAITDPDARFLQRVQSTMDAHLTEPDFTVQEFCREMGMSRMQLHRKLKALTGLSASEFIRSQRLQLAATLLQKNHASISEVGYRSGFNDPSYFSRCFREAYGCTPSEFAAG